MTGTYESFTTGYAPVVKVEERMLLRDIPEVEQAEFVKFLKDRAQKTRSGEVVFPKMEYTLWKQLR
jgi:hypothetical protein